jgi:hypothetical protein
LLCQVRALLSDEFETLEIRDGEGGCRRDAAEVEVAIELGAGLGLSPGTGKYVWNGAKLALLTLFARLSGDCEILEEP